MSRMASDRDLNHDKGVYRSTSVERMSGSAAWRSFAVTSVKSCASAVAAIQRSR